MRVLLTAVAMIALAACAPYPQEARLVPLSVADPVGQIAAEPTTPATGHFPGLLTLAGYGLGGALIATDTVLIGGSPPP